MTSLAGNDGQPHARAVWCMMLDPQGDRLQVLLLLLLLSQPQAARALQVSSNTCSQK